MDRDSFFRGRWIYIVNKCRASGASLRDKDERMEKCVVSSIMPVKSYFMGHPPYNICISDENWAWYMWARARKWRKRLAKSVYYKPVKELGPIDGIKLSHLLREEGCSAYWEHS